MTRNIALRLSYDGARYHGWQVQKTEATVAGTLAAALGRVCGQEITLIGCGRTDAGVHAKSYCANFRTDSRIPASRLPLAVNAWLPRDIAVSAALDAPENFNAILSCRKKEYRYQIFASRIRDPFYAGRAHFYPMPLHVERMREAARHFVGTHDFRAVRSVGTETKTTVRTVYWLDIETVGDIIEISICADGFLYNMARAIVGTLLYVSEGKIDARAIPELLSGGVRQLAGPTAPAEGLYLNRVWYDGAVGDMMAQPAEKAVCGGNF